MSMPRPASPPDEAEEAIARVIESERSARQEVALCERQAAQLVAEARQRVAELHRRTGARIERLRERMALAAKRRLSELRAEQEDLALETRPDAATLERLDAAIALMVAEIAGGPAQG